MYDFSFPLVPVAKGRPRFAIRGNYVKTYTDEKTQKAEENLKFFLAQHWRDENGALRKPLVCPIELRAVFNFVRPKAVSALKRPYPTVGKDVDNLVKLLMDACNDLIWHDDKQVFRVDAAKLYSDTVGTTFTIITR